MEASSTTVTTVTVVTLAATYVCTPQFRVISRHAHNSMEQNRDYAVKWAEAKTEVGSHKPDKLVP